MASPERSNAWSILLSGKRRAPLRLFCFPYAGGNAYIFRSWHLALPEHVEVYGIQLPGRANRIVDPALTHVPQAVAGIGSAIVELLDKPFAFFGHSVGAILCFEVARWLRHRRGIIPAELFVSGRRAPQIPNTDPPTYKKRDDEFLARIRELNGTPSEVLTNPELLRMMLPVLRADFELSETYQYVAGDPLECPITVLGGSDDQESLGDRLPAWRFQTSRGFYSQIFEGDHFFLHSSEREVLNLLRRRLEGLAPPPGSLPYV